MIGFATAFFTELIVDNQGLFGAFPKHDASLFAATGMLLVACSAGLAAASKRKLGMRFTESVLVSLTSVQRSQGSVTAKNVDNAVDFVLDTVFDSKVINRMLDEDKYI